VATKETHDTCLLKRQNEHYLLANSTCAGMCFMLYSFQLIQMHITFHTSQASNHYLHNE